MTDHPADLARLAAMVGQANSYAGKVDHHHDGDTVYVLTHDRVINAPVIVGVRVRGVQAPELRDPGGPEVAAAVAELVGPPGAVVTFGITAADPHPGRVVGPLVTQSGVDVAAWLLARGYAVPYDGKGPKPPVPWPPVPPTGTDVPPAGTASGPKLRDPSEVEATG